MKEIYLPKEDSFLLSEVIRKEIPKVLKKKKEAKFLEIGCGSGIQLEIALESGIKKQNIFSCDISEDAVEHCRKLGFTSIKSNLFKDINGKFDIIIFNPPYLPNDKKVVDKTIYGGKNGSEIINLFLKQAKNYLSDNGVIFLLTSSLTKKIKWREWKRKKILEKKLFFEKLHVYEIKRF